MNTPLPPAWGWMKPKLFSLLNHFTVACSPLRSPLKTQAARDTLQLAGKMVGRPYTMYKY
jgi:hypothetical protein